MARKIVTVFTFGGVQGASPARHLIPRCHVAAGQSQNSMHIKFSASKSPRYLRNAGDKIASSTNYYGRAAEALRIRIAGRPR